MDKQIREDEIYEERRKLARDLDEYEDAYLNFKRVTEPCGHEIDHYLMQLNHQCEQFNEVNDAELIQHAEMNREKLSHVQTCHSQVLDISEQSLKQYRYNFEDQDDELRRELNRLEWV